jgi:hypothetical protein
MDFLDLFYNKKYGGPCPRCVDRAARLGSTDEPGKAVPEGCSLKHKWWRRGGATEVKDGGGLSSVRGQRKARGSSGERVKGGSEGRGCSSPFMGAEGAPGSGGRGGNGQH